MNFSTVACALLTAVLMFGSSGSAQSADLRSSVWENNELAVVRVTVRARNAQGDAVAARSGVGVVVRPNGVIVTAAQAIGQDSDWYRKPDGPDRQIEIFGVDANQI